MISPLILFILHPDALHDELSQEPAGIQIRCQNEAEKGIAHQDFKHVFLFLSFQWVSRFPKAIA